MSSRSYDQYVTQEDVQRLQNVLRRRGGSCTLRDLYRRHSFWNPAIFIVAAEAGLIRIEERRPRTGRPSKVAVLCAGNDSILEHAKLPRRIDRPLGLTRRELRFLDLYLCRWGSPFLKQGRNGGCATHAYSTAFGRGGQPSSASDRSSASRLLRRPWMRAAFLIDRRLRQLGCPVSLPRDLRSEGPRWLSLVCTIDRLCSPWPRHVADVIRCAETYPDAMRRFEEMAAAMIARPEPEDPAVE